MRVRKTSLLCGQETKVKSIWRCKDDRLLTRRNHVVRISPTHLIALIIHCISMSNKLLLSQVSA